MYIDIFIVVVVLWALFSGWRTGFVKELFNLLAAIVGLLIASLIYMIFHEYLGTEGSTVDVVLSVIAFFILAILLPIGLGFFIAPLSRFVKMTPIGLPNSIFGAVAGFLKFLLIISFAFNTLENLNLLDRSRVESSSLYEPVRSVLGVVRSDVADAKAAYEAKKDKATKANSDKETAKPNEEKGSK